MKSVIKKIISKEFTDTMEQMSSILPLLVNDSYVFLDNKVIIQTYSNNTEVFFNQVFKAKIIKGAPFFDQIIKEKELIIPLEAFLKENLANELIDINIIMGGENITIHINKVQKDGKHIGYNCILERTGNGNNQTMRLKLTNELSEIMSKTIESGEKLIRELSPNLKACADRVNFLEWKLEKLKQDSAEIISVVKQINSAISKASHSLIILPRFPDVEIRNVMILDDDELVHFVTKSIIDNTLPGINTLSFTNTEEAAEFLETHPTDIILIDLEMLGKSSWSFLNIIQQQGVKVPVIIISHTVDPETLLRIPKFPQIKGILTKPIEKKHLINILSK
ncbi:MAG: response regulator [Pedobacter sp.]|nr:MAG: response regulator [Pedobacter sp.]